MIMIIDVHWQRERSLGKGQNSDLIETITQCIKTALFVQNENDTKGKAIEW